MRTDFSCFEQLNLEKEPVGIKFMFFKPPNIQPLAYDRNLSFCEMLVEAQEAELPFYFSRQNNETCVGKILLGMNDMEPFAESGQIGDRLGIFQDARANHVFYQYIPVFGKDTVNYVAFAPLSKLNFDSDVLILTAPPSQAEIVMRAVTYSTGELYSSQATPVMGCAWSFIYPYLSGKVNYLLPEMIHGMKGRQLFSEDTVLISIPFQWMQTVAQNLFEMNLHLPSHASKENYLNKFEQVISDLVEESQNP